MTKPTTDDDLEPNDPRRDCPWKCEQNTPSCLCERRWQALRDRHMIYGVDN